MAATSATSTVVCAGTGTAILTKPPRPGARILIVGERPEFRWQIQRHLSEGIEVRTADTTDEVEGVGIDLVVAAGRFPISEFKSATVHPKLAGRPVVVVAPGCCPDDVASSLPNVVVVSAARDLARHVAAAVHRLLAGHEAENGIASQPRFSSLAK